MQLFESHEVRSCRICGAPSLERILDLGAQPPANSLRKDPGASLPLVPLVLCRCEVCRTVQLSETVREDYLFRDYVWVTGTSEVARDYSRVFCDRLAARCRPGPLFVVEIASNDGTFLSRFRERGDTVLGVDPARNVAMLAERAGIPTIAEFFGMRVAREIVETRGPADAVFARNVIPHVADAADVVAGMAHCLADRGTGAIEFHSAEAILAGLQYDSIYHEHLFYHSLHSVARLVDRCGLTLFDVDTSPISGGSLVAYVSKTVRPPSAALSDVFARERASGLAGPAVWRDFAAGCERHRGLLKDLIEAKKRGGARIVGYGASARSATLLNFCGIDHRHLDVIADRSPLKQGRFAPGSDIPIASPEDAFARRPDLVLLLAWNFRDEILAEITAEQGWHGDVIVPLPGDPKVVTI